MVKRPNQVYQDLFVSIRTSPVVQLPLSERHGRQRSSITAEIKGPDNPTSQLLPILSKKSCCGDGEGRKDKGRGGGKMVCDKVVCVKDGV